MKKERILISTMICLVPMIASSQSQLQSRLQKVGKVDLPDMPIGSKISMSPSGFDILIESDDDEKDINLGPRLLPIEKETRAPFFREKHFKLHSIVSISPDSASLKHVPKPQPDGSWLAFGKVVARGSIRSPAIPPVRLPKEYSATAIREFPQGQKRRQTIPNAEGLRLLRAVKTTDGMRFEDAFGIPVFPDSRISTDLEFGSGWDGTTGLFAIYPNGDSLEITFPTPRDAVISFSYDPISKRVLTRGSPSGYVLFDLKTKSRHAFEDYDANSRTRKSYLLVPGRDSLLCVRNYLGENPGDSYSEIRPAKIFYTNLAGESLQEISEHPISSVHITASKSVVAFLSHGKNGLTMNVYAIKD